MQNYPELEDAPSICSDKALPYFRVDPVVVRAPFNGVDIAEVELEGVINTEDSQELLDLFLPMQDTFEDAGEGTLGWEGDEEMDFLTEMKTEAATLAAESVDYQGPQAQQVRDLAFAAIDIFDSIDAIYAVFHGEVLYTVAEGGVQAFPLSVHAAEFEAQLLNPEPQWEETRWANRETIRRAWDHALSLVWCADVILAELEVRGKNAAHASVAPQAPTPPTAPTPGRGLTPTAPPTPPPGGEWAPAPPDTTPRPDPNAPGEAEFFPPESEPEAEIEEADPAPASTSGGGGAALLLGVVVVGFLLSR